MLIAQNKLKNNIVEYILYMWRIEDLLRAMKFDIELVKTSLVDLQTEDTSQRDEIIKWYQGLIDKMKVEGLEKIGHLNELQEKVQELNFLHFILTSSMPDEVYVNHLNKIKPMLEEFKAKSDMPNNSDVEVCLHALNMKLLLKLQSKPITKETEEAFVEFSNLLAMLSKRYKNQFDLVN